MLVAVGRMVHLVPVPDPGKRGCLAAAIVSIHASGNPNLDAFDPAGTYNGYWPDALLDPEGTGRTWHDPRLCPYDSMPRAGPDTIATVPTIASKRMDPITGVIVYEIDPPPDV